jgi:hypothetical protein
MCGPSLAKIGRAQLLFTIPAIQSTLGAKYCDEDDLIVTLSTHDIVHVAMNVCDGTQQKTKRARTERTISR